MPSHPEPPSLHDTAARIRARRSAGFTLVEIMIVVAILGLLAALAIPAMSAYARRTKTAEARLQLAKMFDSTAAYFIAEHVDRGDVETIGSGGTVAVGASHRCPAPSASPGGGEAGFTPSIDCNDGPSGRCVPSGAPPGAGYYPIDVWSTNEVWSGLDFGLEQAHYFHYNFSATNNLVGYGSCNFTAHAFGNLDADATFSTFERTGAADQQGVNGAAGLYIDLVIE